MEEYIYFKNLQTIHELQEEGMAKLKNIGEFQCALRYNNGALHA
jgi:hypothetical protein